MNQTTHVPPHQSLSMDLDCSSSFGNDPSIIIKDVNPHTAILKFVRACT